MQKQVAAIHDLSGYGLCSLGVALPVLTAMQAYVCALPTAYLSSHTGYPNFTFEDMTQAMNPALDHWRDLGLKFDAVYSGFLGSAEQIAIVARAVEMFKPEVAIIDPVMGDDGKVYKTYTPEMCDNMRKLIESATVITPNVTEAAILLGKEPSAQPTREELRDWLVRLSGGKRDVVLTGIRNAQRVEVWCYEYRTGQVTVIERGYVGRAYHGTGDLYSSVLLGWLLRGQSLCQAAENAADFVMHAAAYTHQNYPDSGDIAFSPELRRII
ncbi:MAG: pyridoxamine kinase [Oscillospiraceae bacterium]|nr:pyridoxamine kinase [Oscillospiraceae bacterium]